MAVSQQLSFKTGLLKLMGDVMDGLLVYIQSMVLSGTCCVWKVIQRFSVCLCIDHSSLSLVLKAH